MWLLLYRKKASLLSVLISLGMGICFSLSCFDLMFWELLLRLHGCCCCCRESEGSFYYGNYNHEADDLRSVFQHFSDMDRVVPVVLGHSKGGDVVLLYASKYHDIRNVINLSGRYDLKKGITERLGEDFLETIKQQGFIDVKDGKSGYRVTEESLMERLSTDMHEACLNIDKECRVLTVHGSDDVVIPVEDANEFAKIIPNHKLEIVEGADHCYTKHQSQLVATVTEFIKTVILKNN
ncbi:PREDICTED: uncharacterized protein LOC106331754 isoform X1 [Brassica oleracea var. oleracea]|uniref:uncharacterized protein LOC106331754 isoform X1 n=1 Tax=Brassica oleracea var. oleracea TaxID=109376 RepID=UPI0006A7473E|nr:PREDICTED: uncharacterized protein LOC106331754 isoform X1 [Brassica oleracea var. oleracea]XP_013625614.1 PREDICTED: uncharacterized protein LOC106331754 isoform X1 [Brassica oleracea var. oleracea]XP_013625615.1 PREDICTED: uncharacterized protein LOC106331754 isoform X1 [Brassica oleracea var. oleracea]